MHHAVIYRSADFFSYKNAVIILAAIYSEQEQIKRSEEQTHYCHQGQAENK